MSRIPQDIIDQIARATDIVEVVSERVDLKQRGQNWVGLCPFHAEKTPSFNVHPDGWFKCFGCLKAGGVYQFLMEIEQLTFPEAVRELGAKAGIAVEAGAAPQQDDTPELRKVAAWARGWFEDNLWGPQGREALAYMRDRGFSDETLRAFNVGFAPDGWTHLLDAAQREGLRTEALLKVGLARENQEKRRTYDFYRNRVIFPITDRRGRTIGFGGRIMPGADQDIAKYFNSPESPLYKKGQALFGYAQGKDAIRQGGQIVVAEGYTDVMMAHQAGYPFVVACCGTSLTQQHAQLLARVATERVVFLFDGDRAGQAAAEKNLTLMLPLERTVAVASLPGGADPHEYILAEGPQAFGAALDETQDFYSFKLDQVRQRHDVNDPAGQARAIDEMIGVLRLLRNPVEQELQAARIAREFGISVEALRSRQFQRQSTSRQESEYEQLEATRRAKREAMQSRLMPEALLLTVLCKRPDLGERVIDRYPLGRITDPSVRAIAEVIYPAFAEARDAGAPLPQLDALVSRFQNQSTDTELIELLIDAAHRCERPEELDRALADFLQRSSKRDRKAQLAGIKASLREAEQAKDHARVAQLTREYQALLSRR